MSLGAGQKRLTGKLPACAARPMRRGAALWNGLWRWRTRRVLHRDDWGGAKHERSRRNLLKMAGFRGFRAGIGEG